MRGDVARARPAVAAFGGAAFGVLVASAALAEAATVAITSRAATTTFTASATVAISSRAATTAAATATGATTAALAAATAGAATAVTVRDDRGATLAFASPPQRIVSLLPSLTESVCALGACARLVGTDRYSSWPASVAGLPKLGGLEDAQVERIAALRPDLVVASTSARVVDRLEALGLRVLVLDSQTHADARRTLAVLARVLALPAADADAVWARIERELDAAAMRVPLSWRGRSVYFEIDPTPYAAGAASFVGETLARIGLANAVPAALGPFPRLNPEYVVRLQPDVVVASADAVAAMAKRPGWSALRALRERRTCAFASERYAVLVRAGPRLGEAAGLLADCVAALPPPPSAPLRPATR